MSTVKRKVLSRAEWSPFLPVTSLHCETTDITPVRENRKYRSQSEMFVTGIKVLKQVMTLWPPWRARNAYVVVVVVEYIEPFE